MFNYLKTAFESINPNQKTIIEFGVYKGKTLQYIRNHFDDSFRVYGFDSFEGLPEDWIGAITKERIDGVKTGRKIDIKKGHFTTQGIIPDIDKVTFYKGWFKNTIPEYLKKHQDPIGLLHIDCDLYSSTKMVLWSLNDFIIPGTIIAFDDWFYNANINCNDGEQKAFLKWTRFFKRKFEFVNFQGEGSRKVMQKVVKILE